MSFADRERPKSNEPTRRGGDGENDYAFAEVTEVRIGSAHACSGDESRDAHLLDLMRRLIAHVHRNGEHEVVEIEHK